jgi:hypothetical protein
MESLTSCECTDPGCPVCKGECNKVAVAIAFRVDTEDNHGTSFCAECLADALDCGLFWTDQESPHETREN